MFRGLSKIILFFTFLDWVFFLGWDMVSPLLAIFITREIGGTIAAAGLAVAVTLLTRALFQIPLSLLFDRRGGEEDDFVALATSVVVAGFVALGFYFATHMWQVFLLQALQGFRGALYAATWPAIFSRHIDPTRASFSWSLDTATLAIVSGIAGGLGGYLVQLFGFRIVFLLVASLSFLSVIPLFLARPFLIKK